MPRPALVLALACVAPACLAAPPEHFEGELILGTLDADYEFAPYEPAPDEPDGPYLVEVMRGFQGADMVVVVVELPTAYLGERVDLSCWIETADWTSRAHEIVLEDQLVPNDRRLYAPYLILGWWTGEVTAGQLGCETIADTRSDTTILDIRLVPAASPP